jgi:hypothetical protein
LSFRSKLQVLLPTWNDCKAGIKVVVEQRIGIKKEKL